MVDLCPRAAYIAGPVKIMLCVDVSRSGGKIDTRAYLKKNRTSDTQTIKNGLDITSAIFRSNFKT
jgi:hypothetical protein